MVNWQNPTKEELLEFFQEMIDRSMWVGRTINEMVEINATKYGYGPYYNWFMVNLNKRGSDSK